MNNKITLPKLSMVEENQYFFRHPEMFRAKLDEEDVLLIDTDNQPRKEK